MSDSEVQSQERTVYILIFVWKDLSVIGDRMVCVSAQKSLTEHYRFFGTPRAVEKPRNPDGV